MLKKVFVLAIASLVATGAFAQQTVQDAQNLMTQAGIEIEIPATATQDQIDQIIAILGDSSLSVEDQQAQVKQILGM